MVAQDYQVETPALPIRHGGARRVACPASMDETRIRGIIDELEQAPARVELHAAGLEQFIAWCMDEIYRLSVSGEDNDRKMRLVALEYRARNLLGPWKRLRSN